MDLGLADKRAIVTWPGGRLHRGDHLVVAVSMIGETSVMLTGTTGQRRWLAPMGRNRHLGP